jgi:hypothetical protein
MLPLADNVALSCVGPIAQGRVYVVRLLGPAITESEQPIDDISVRHGNASLAEEPHACIS